MSIGTQICLVIMLWLSIITLINSIVVFYIRYNFYRKQETPCVAPERITNRIAINTMTHSDLLLFLSKRLDIRLCRMCRNFESTPDNPDICRWQFLEQKCVEGFNKWLEDDDLEGEEDARIA